MSKSNRAAMTRREHIERAVATILMAAEIEPEDMCWLQGQFVTLLLREQRRAMRTIRRQEKWILDKRQTRMRIDQHGPFILVHDLLTALRGRK